MSNSALLWLSILSGFGASGILIEYGVPALPALAVIWLAGFSGIFYSEFVDRRSGRR